LQDSVLKREVVRKVEPGDAKKHLRFPTPALPGSGKGV